MEPRLNSHAKSCEKHRSKTQTQQREGLQWAVWDTLDVSETDFCRISSNLFPIPSLS